MELLNYWPEFMAALKEFQMLAQTEQPEISDAIQAVRAMPNDFYIETLSEGGAARWEQILGLPVAHVGNLPDRRFRILTKSTEQLPFTMPRLQELMGTLCGADGFTAVMTGATFTLTVRVALTAKQNFDDVEALLDRIVPSNMVIDLSLLYNQHSALQSSSHAKLAGYTHEQLRNEVI